MGVAVAIAIAVALLLRAHRCCRTERQFKTHAYLFANTDEDGTNLKLSTSLLGLAIVTGLVALLSEFLVDAIDGFTEEVCNIYVQIYTVV